MESVFSRLTFVVSILREEMKTSLALIGTKGEGHKNLINRLVHHCQLILVSEFEGEVFDAVIGQHDDVMIQSCAKEGCWEADIIFLLNDRAGDVNLLDAIKEVSTQKVVVGFSETMDEFSQRGEFSTLKQTLPHSKVLWGYIDDTGGQVFIHGSDGEAIERMRELIEKMDYRAVYIESFKEENVR